MSDSILPEDLIPYNAYISKLGKLQLRGDDLLLARMKGPSIYTKELFQYMQAVSRALAVPGSCPVKFKTIDAQGNEIELEASGAQQLGFPSLHRWCSPQQYGDVARSNQGLIRLGEIPQPEMMIPSQTEPEVAAPTKCCQKGTCRWDLALSQSVWKKSKMRKSIISHIEANAKRMATVHSIVCFGLGPLEKSPSLSDHPDRNFLQHVAAIEIREAFQKAQPNREIHRDADTYRDIPIIIQDPKYCADCITILQWRQKMQVFITPAGFTNLNGNSFIITKAPAVPVRQIVADITEEYGGPAGMLCDPIQDDGVNNAVNTCSLLSDPSSDRLLRFQKKNADLELLLNDTGEMMLDRQGEPLKDDNDVPMSFTVFENVGLYLKKREV